MTFLDDVAASYEFFVRMESVSPEEVIEHVPMLGNTAFTDQYAMAMQEARQIVHTAPAINRSHADDTLYKRAYLMTGLLRCPPCEHLRANLAQPAFTYFRFRITLCGECSAHTDLRTREQRVPETQCDLCDNEPEDMRYWPTILNFGPHLFMGDVCEICWSVLSEGLEDE
jgi:hypothetical protein